VVGALVVVDVDVVEVVVVVGGGTVVVVVVDEVVVVGTDAKFPCSLTELSTVKIGPVPPCPGHVAPYEYVPDQPWKLYPPVGLVSTAFSRS